MQPAGERRRLHRPTFLSRKIRTNCRLNIRLLFIKYIANKTLLTDFEKPCWLSGCLAAYIFTTRIHTATCFLKYLWNMQWPTYVLFIFQDVSFTRYTYLLQSLDVNDMLLSHLRLFGVWTGWAVTYLDALGSFHITTSQKDSHRIEPGNLQSAETVLKPQNVLCGWNLNLRQLFLEGKIHQIMRLWTRIHSEDFFQQD